MYGEVPAGSVVVAGSMPSKATSTYCAVIVKKVDAQTRSKTSMSGRGFKMRIHRPDRCTCNHGRSPAGPFDGLYRPDYAWAEGWDCPKRWS